MVRTKVPKARKHRRSSTDPKQIVDNQLRELDLFATTFETDIDGQYRETCDELENMLNKIKSRIPKSVMHKTLGEIRDVCAKTFADVPLLTDKNLTVTTASSNLSTIMEKSHRNKSKDDGYITEETADEMSDQGTLKKSKRLGPLASAQARRSKSANSSYTPFMNTQKHIKTPMIGINATAQNLAFQNAAAAAAENERASRSKMRTPLNNRVKAASADRAYLITPKVNPSIPLAILRHAKAGEAVFSITGSPVTTSNINENTANVNIPVTNGVLSIRPTEMKSVDSRVVDRLDLATIAELKQLQSNLNMLITMACKK